MRLEGLYPLNSSSTRFINEEALLNSMNFESNKALEDWGVNLGFLVSYFVFTTILFLILTFLGKIPKTSGYLFVVAITLGITVVGYITRRLLK